ncbi:hypothetical protein [Enterococcus sp. DIV0800]|uniref:hypothetical protein n=1 Tax=unclassified Enterococcus TaxID=2608891 RepID=UPI003D30126B
MKLPRNEQETIFTYSINENWHIYTDVPKHIRKYLPLVKSPKLTEENGEIITLEGFVDGNVSARAKRVMSDEQRQAASDRLKAAKNMSGEETK